MRTLVDARVIAQRLDEAIEQLNTALRAAEDALQRLAIGVTASVPMPTGETLSWTKDGAAWCLVVTSASGGWSLLFKSRKASRIAAASTLPALLDALIVAAVEQHAKVIGAREAASAFLVAIEQPECLRALKRTP